MSGDTVDRLLVYCDDKAHTLYRVDPRQVRDADADDLPDDVVIIAGFTHDPDVGWIVDPFSARWGGRVRDPHRNTVQYINAAGKVVPLWGNLRQQADAVTAAKSMAGAGDGEEWSMGRRYQMMCPVCLPGRGRDRRRQEVRRSDGRMSEDFNSVVKRGYSAVSLAFLNGQ